MGLVFEDHPTGEVNGVCWKLMTAIVIGAGLVVRYLISEKSDLKKEIAALHEENKKDREKFTAETNLLVNNVLRKKGGQSP